MAWWRNIQQNYEASIRVCPSVSAQPSSLLLQEEERHQKAWSSWLGEQVVGPSKFCSLQRSTTKTKINLGTRIRFINEFFVLCDCKTAWVNLCITVPGIRGSWESLQCSERPIGKIQVLLWRPVSYLYILCYHCYYSDVAILTCLV